MLRDIISLAVRHWRENWLRETLCLLIVAAVSAILYAGNVSDIRTVSESRIVMQLSNLRNGIILWWIIATAVYTLFTAFHGYSNIHRCYATLLLPACRKAKYAWELLRTIVIFPLATLVLIWGIDTLAIKYMVHVRPMLTDIFGDTGSLWDIIIATGEPLNYIPCIIYLVVWFNSVAMLVRSGLRPTVATATVIAALAMVLTFPWLSERAILYPFIWVDIERAFPIGSGFPVELWMPMSWCSRMTGYVISYVWYAALPLAVYVLSYLKFKEREI